jgi:RsiW-degrading membrane proteinase PrsW (M82 family)
VTLISAAPSDRLKTAPPLRKTRVCSVLDMLLLATLALAVLGHLSMLSRMEGDVLAVFLHALLWSTLLAVIPVTILWFLDRRERENPWMLAAAFLWGGCIATALSLPLNTAFFRVVDRWIALNPIVTEVLGPDAVTLIAAPLSAPIVEEVAKAAGVVLIFWMLRREFDGMRDGFVYGALVGVGFNWFEAPLYVMQGYAEQGVAPYSLQLGLRHGLLGLGGHAMFTGLFGLFLGLAVQTSRIWLRLLAPLLGLLLAVGAHLINNALPLLGALAAAAEGEPVERELERQAVANIGLLQAMFMGAVPQFTLFLPFTLIVVIALWRSGVWERRVIRDELASEVGRCITPAEYQAIVGDRLLRTRRVNELHPRRSAALVNAQHELAFRKRRVREQGGDPDHDELVASWRRDIVRLREQGAGPAV